MPITSVRAQGEALNLHVFSNTERLLISKDIKTRERAKCTVEHGTYKYLVTLPD